MTKRLVEVTFTVEVETDDAQFTPEWMADFRRYFYEFDDIEDHVCHIAQLAARDMADGFVEGYGVLSDIGIKAKIVDQTEDIVEEG